MRSYKGYKSYKQSMLKMQLNFQQSTKMLEEEMSRLREKMNRTPKPPVEHPSPFPRVPEVVIRREFRINDQIGEPGQRSGTSYHILTSCTK